MPCVGEGGFSLEIETMPLAPFCPFRVKAEKLALSTTRPLYAD